MKQDIAFKILKDGYNVFLTGPAGSGKTYLLNQYITHLKKENVRYAVTAATGIAATHLSGRTIHSWSGVGIHNSLSERDIKDILKNHLIKERLKNTRVLIIDEISMIHAHQLDLINKITRLARASWEPFGGMQVVFSGDFFQLPPIITKDSDIKRRFVFDAQIWKEMDVKICYLSEQFRHCDNQIIQILGDIRNNTVNEGTVEKLQETGTDFDSSDDVTRLFTHNIDVDKINERKLAKIPGKSYVYDMLDDGQERIVQALKKSCLAPEKLILKEGALVMFIRNNFDEGYVNGTIGTVVDFTDDGFPIVETIDGEEVSVYPEKWELTEENETLAEIMQLPLRLAWAITIHKSQGMTLDAAEIDLRKCFEYGMGYVALSRVRSLSGIRLLGINDMALKVDPEILKKDKEFQKLSKKAEKEIK
ncbi:MAG: helicase [Candidatus Moraniibacteriota bacterium]|nr:MAG: helicase [Candidatus Moranbacteria bacterium]